MGGKLFQARIDIQSVIEVDPTTWEIQANIQDVSGSFTALDTELGDKVFITGVSDNGVTTYDRYRVSEIVGGDAVHIILHIIYDEVGTPKTIGGYPLTGSHLVGRSYGPGNKLMEMPSSHEVLDEFRKDQGMSNMNMKELAETTGVPSPVARIVECKVVSDTINPIVGDGKLIFCIPLELNTYNLIAVAAYLTTVGAEATTIQIRNVTTGNDMLTTPITIDASTLTSYTSATPAAISATFQQVSAGNLIAIDVDSVASASKGLGVILTFNNP